MITQLVMDCLVMALNLEDIQMGICQQDPDLIVLEG